MKNKKFSSNFKQKPSEYFMAMAIAEAKKALKTGDVPVGAVIVRDGCVISSACNRKEKCNNPIKHAEINVIQSAVKKLKNWRLEDCTLYVTLEPCFMCAGAIQLSRIEKVVFGAYDRKNGAYGGIAEFQNISGLNHYPEIEAGILADECAALLKDFFKNLREENCFKSGKKKQRLKMRIGGLTIHKPKTGNRTAKIQERKSMGDESGIDEDREWMRQNQKGEDETEKGGRIIRREMVQCHRRHRR